MLSLTRVHERCHSAKQKWVRRMQKWCGVLTQIHWLLQACRMALINNLVDDLCCLWTYLFLGLEHVLNTLYTGACVPVYLVPSFTASV